MRIDFLCKNVIVPKYRIAKLSLKFLSCKISPCKSNPACKRVAVQKCPLVQKWPSCKRVAVQKCPLVQKWHPPLMLYPTQYEYCKTRQKLIKNFMLVSTRFQISLYVKSITFYCINVLSVCKYKYLVVFSRWYFVINFLLIIILKTFSFCCRFYSELVSHTQLLKFTLFVKR